MMGMKEHREEPQPFYPVCYPRESWPEHVTLDNAIALNPALRQYNRGVLLDGWRAVMASEPYTGSSALDVAVLRLWIWLGSEDEEERK